MKDRIRKASLLRLLCLFLLTAALSVTAGACACYIPTGNYVKDGSSVEYASTEAEAFETMAEGDAKEILEKLEEDRRKAFQELTDSETGTPAKVKQQSVDEDAESVDVYYSENVYNLMLIGVDRRDKTWNGNSDTMILISINHDKQKVTMTSFMRDTWVNIPGVGMRKMNAAFAVGGGPLLVQTVAANFGLSVDNYAWIDFDGMKAVIDALGGVDVELTAAEGRYIGVTVTGASSVVHLNGDKALAYARDRTTSGWDYGRTQRQRNILMSIVNKVKGGGFSDLSAMANTILPYFTHNIDQGKMLTLMMDLTKVSGYTFQEQRVPYDGLYYSQNQNLVPDYGATIVRLYNAIY